MRIRILTYNIDGLPEILDLNDLPWLLKPIAWIYKLIKGTTVIVINDNQDKKGDIEKIGQYIMDSDADIVAVQEDFNYHDVLVNTIKSKYKTGYYTGGFDLSKLFSNTEWWSCFPFPRFKCDGLNILTKNAIGIYNEDILRWKKSYGYFSHANDKLAHKGFRYYKVKIGDYQINVYILHMDADFYNSETCPDVEKDIKARKSQFEQLVDYISESPRIYPSLVIGDTNSYKKYQWDVANMENSFIAPIRKLGFDINEIVAATDDCDRIFYINTSSCNYIIKPIEAHFDEVYMSDHKPLMATFDIITK